MCDGDCCNLFNRSVSTETVYSLQKVAPLLECVSSRSTISSIFAADRLLRRTWAGDCLLLAFVVEPIRVRIATSKSATRSP